MNLDSDKSKNFISAPKIDVVMRYFLPVTAGIEINVWNTYKKLVKNGWDVTLHVTRDTYTEKNILPENEVIDGIKIRRYEFHPLGFSPDIDFKSTDAICLHNFDIFPHLWIMLKTLYFKLSGKKTFNLFVTPHGGFCPEWSVFGFISRNVKHAYTNTIGLFLLNRTADGIRAVSPWEADEMIRIGVKFNLIQVVTNGLEDEAYMDVANLASEDIKKKVSTFGTYVMDNSRIKPIKNITTIIKALSLLPKDIHFVHIGTTQDEKYKKSLFDLIKSLGLESRVHMLGVVRGIDKYYLYKNAAVFVHPALWEANANVVHEAWSQELTTIVGNNTGMRAQVKNGVNGYLAEVDDEEKLSELIFGVIKNRDSKLIKSFSEINLKYVKNHSWGDVGNRMGDFYLRRMNNRFAPFLVKNNLQLEFNDEIENIIKNKLKCYFISPHLDDAVYSAGSLIKHLSRYTEVNVLSVFTEASNHKTFSIRSFLKQCKSKSAIDLFKSRREEDIKVCESIGAKAVHLGFLDAPWRIKKVAGLKNFISKLFPEFKSIYPIHRLHIAKGNVSEEDNETIGNIRLALDKEINKVSNRNVVIFGPSGIGSHVDHVIVKNICREMFLSPIYWADVPYINNGKKINSGDMLGDLVLGPDLEGKFEILKGYESQFEAMFKSKTEDDLLPEMFYFSSVLKEKPKVSVAIPAYNEEGNIRNLLESIVSQKQINYELFEILVVSDGSTDKTISEAKSVNSDKIKIFDHKSRRGVMERQNEIFRIFKGDILVLLNADVLPRSDYYINKMVIPFLKNEKIAIVSNRGIPMPAETFIEKILNYSVLTKLYIFEKFKNGDNIYMCHGHSRAFSREFSKNIRWPSATAEDAYSYLRAKELGYSFYYEPSAGIYFRSPQNLMDHIKQSSRFINSKIELRKYFFKEDIKRCFKLPVCLTIKIILVSIFKNPILFLGYLFIFIISNIDSLIINRAIRAWDPSVTSKVLIKKM